MRLFYVLLIFLSFNGVLLTADADFDSGSIYRDQLSAASNDSQNVSGETGGVVSSGREGEYDPAGYGTCELVETINNVLTFLIGISILIAVIVFMYAGYMMVYSSGNSSLLQQAKGLFGNILIGIMLLFSAYLIVNTILSILVGGVSGVFSWKSIECSYAYKVGEVVEYGTVLKEQEIADFVTSGGYVSTGGATGGVAVGGSCSARTSGVCSVENLRPYFGDRAEEASRICSKESGGAPVQSRSDICCGSSNPADCAGAPSFSGGYFQINVLVHANKIPGCSAGFYDRNGTEGPQGDCIKRNPKGVCIGWSCKITNTSVYNECMKVTTNQDLNLQIAKKLYDRSGFKPWAWSASICNIPY